MTIKNGVSLQLFCSIYQSLDFGGLNLEQVLKRVQTARVHNVTEDGGEGWVLVSVNEKCGSRVMCSGASAQP